MASRKTVLPTPRTERRATLSQSDIPAFPIEKALAIAKAIGDNYAYKPATPLDVASALGVVPTTGNFRMLTGASLAYGLTVGGYNAGEITITALGLRIVRPLSDDGDVDRAKKEAVLLPKLVGDFLRKYDGAALPKAEIAQNVLLTLGVPSERCKDALELILENAKSVGFLRQINDRTFIDLKGTNATPVQSRTEEQPDANNGGFLPLPQQGQREPSTVRDTAAIDEEKALRTRKVFIAHGKNRALIEPIKKFLKFGNLEPVVSTFTQTVSMPVPGKIMEDMRSCGAAIIHVDNERTLLDEEGNRHIILNDNVLIEIGAAMALFGARFILVVKDGIKLPSNLLGLLELRYKGETLDIDDTGKLFEAIVDMKGRSLP